MSPFTLLIILIVIIFGIGGILFWINHRLKYFFKIKITHWLILIYIFVLLASTVIVPFVSKEITLLNTQERQDEDKTYIGLTEKLENGQSEKIDKKYILAEHSFKVVDNETLAITSSPESWPYVYVKRKEDNDGKIEAVIFQEMFIIDDVDFSELLEPYEMKLVDNRLTIRPNQQNLNLSIMHSPFPVRQLANVSIMHSSSSRGDQQIYLQIPRDLKLKADENFNLRYVE